VLCLSLSTSSKAENLSTGENVDAFVERHIASAHVVVFAKTYCHYCANTKRVLGDLHEKSKDGWALDVIDLDQLPAHDGPIIQMELLTKTGQRTVPNIFIGGKHVGGNSDLVELQQSGKLTMMLSSA
jgi:glutaredoxin 3